MLSDRVKLTTTTSGGGCSSKIGSADLAEVLRDFPASEDPNVIVGFSTSDDAGVYQLTDDIALVQTVDFFTPIVDDPYDFGRIAATNAISDVYAMGGTPRTALNIATFPLEALGHATLSRILAGGAAVAKEAGVAILGGHTVKDDEPKYGMAVTGTVHPKKAITNAGARAGDTLVLTKPLGTGILSNALKKGAIDETQIAPAVRWMTTLNRGASLAMIAANAHAATDITGFGLLGHGFELARARGEPRTGLRTRARTHRRRHRTRRQPQERNRTRSLHDLRSRRTRRSAITAQRRADERRALDRRRSGRPAETSRRVTRTGCACGRDRQRRSGHRDYRRSMSTSRR
jgi:selenide,water dikinase